MGVAGDQQTCRAGAHDGFTTDSDKQQQKQLAGRPVSMSGQL